MNDWFHDLARNGFTVISEVFRENDLDAIRRACAEALASPMAADSILVNGDGPPHGARNLLRFWPEAAELVRKQPLAEMLLRVLGPSGGVVRGLYFDKPAGGSWGLPWHRDTTIAVKKHAPFGRFGKPTVKAGVPHVEAPMEILEQMLTVRIHLDAVHIKNGPLRVVPGSHLVTTSERKSEEGVSVHCNAGDVLLMRPLLQHASAHCETDHCGHRRIVHLECAPNLVLPEGYEWQTFVPLALPTI